MLERVKANPQASRSCGFHLEEGCFVQGYSFTIEQLLVKI